MWVGFPVWNKEDMLVQFIEYDIRRAQVQQLTFCDAGSARASRKVAASANITDVVLLTRFTTSNEIN
jgi:hypothetical protein